MIAIVAANVVLVLLALGIVSKVLPAKAFSGGVTVLHKTIGITLPAPGKERAVAVVWIVSLLVIADGILFLMVFLARSVAAS